MRGVDNGRGRACVGVREGGNTVPSAQFCCELKITLNNKVYLGKKKKTGKSEEGRQNVEEKE